MKRAVWLVGLVAVAAAGCMNVQVNPLAHELNYQLTPARNVEAELNKSVAVVAFDDGRMTGGLNVTHSTSPWLNCVPFVWYTTQQESHPEVTHNTAKSGWCTKVKAAGTLNEALPQLLAEYLGRARMFSKVQYVEPSEVKSGSYDFVVRGTVVKSELVTKRFSYLLGPAAVVPYLLGAPVARYQASLTVEWQLYTTDGKPFSAKKNTASVVAPVVQWRGLYYGNCANDKAAPLGLYVEAVRQVNAKIADDLKAMLFEK